MIEVSWQIPDSGTEIVRCCVLPYCSWTHIEPPCRPMVARSLDGDAITEAINRAVNAHHAETEAVLLDHMRSHDVVEYVQAVADLRQALATRNPDHPLVAATSPAKVNGRQL